MTYCTRCGAAAIGYGLFCASCGAEIVAVEPGRRLEDDKGPSVAEAVEAKTESGDAEAPASWHSALLESGQLRRLVVAGLASYAVTLLLSAVLATILVLAIASLLDVLLGGSSNASASQPTAPAGASDFASAIHLYVAFTSYVFFASHFGPLEASGLGGATFSVLGIGSLSISILAVLLPFVLARRIDRRLKASTASAAFLRGAVTGVPYGIGALALFLAGYVSIGTQQFGLSIHPSVIGVFSATAMASLGGGLGAASIRSVLNPVASSVRGGVARSLFAIAIGAVLTAAIAVAWVGVGALTHSAGSTTSSGPAPTSAAQQLGWSLAGLVPFYLLNAIALIWSAALDGTLFSASALHLLIYAGPLIGALLPALTLRRPADRIEQAAYAGSFAIGAGLLGLGVTPAIVNGAALLPNPWTAVLVALIFGAATAFGAPYLLAVGPIQAFASGAQALIVRPLPGVRPSDFIHPAPAAPTRAPSRRHVRLSVGWLYAVVAAVAIVLTSGGLVANAQLNSHFSPEAAAQSYLAAEGRGDADAMWGLMTFGRGSPPASSRFLTKNALKAMLAYPDNRAISTVSVMASNRQSNGDFAVTVRVSRSGQRVAMQLNLRRDPSHANWVVYPYWRVLIVPSVVEITTYPHAGEVSVDGIESGIGGQGGSIAVIPGIHHLELAATDIFAGETRRVDASVAASVAFATQLSGVPSIALTKEIEGYFQQCAAAKQLSPSGCPNSVTPEGDHQSRIQWKLVGDPSASVLLESGDAVDTVVASGAWQMHVSFDYWSNPGNARVKHWDQDISGNFNHTLLWDGTSFDVTNHTGATSGTSLGASSVPQPSITATLAGQLPYGSHTWQVTGQYFTPGQRVEVFLYEPPNSANSASANAPGLGVRPDGTFSGNFELASHPGPAMVKACDTANICATVLVTAP